VLVDLLGSTNVYFQPPETVKIQYPCIIYQRVKNDVKFANNGAYLIRRKYSLLVIDQNPDTEIPDKISALPLCSSGAFYTFQNLNHYPFTIYY
jgi:hypothetical protein